MIDEKCEAYYDMVEIIDSHPGIDKVAAQAVLVEIGTDMESFHSADHLASWCGLSPGNHESAGKRVKAGNNHIKTILCQCAHATANTKNTYISSRYWSIKARRGPQKAAIATDRKIIVTLYHMLKNKANYLEPGPDAYTKARQKNKERALKKKLEALGYEVIEKNKAV